MIIKKQQQQQCQQMLRNTFSVPNLTDSNLGGRSIKSDDIDHFMCLLYTERGQHYHRRQKGTIKYG